MMCIAVCLLMLVPAITPPVATAQADTSLSISITHISDPQESSRITIAGTITNTLDIPVSSLQVRLQAAPQISSSRGMREVLSMDESRYDRRTDFKSLPNTLNPGETTDFSLSVSRTVLGLQSPGVYPLLVNVNGAPAGRGLSRLQTTRTLSTILGKAAEKKATAALAITWPIAEAGHYLPLPSFNDGIDLASPTFIDNMRPGGRLDGLVQALGRYSARRDGIINKSLCVSLDPATIISADRVASAQSVRSGDQELEDASQVARQWLGRLREQLEGRCVLAATAGAADEHAVLAANVPQLNAFAFGAMIPTVESILGRPLTAQDYPLASGQLSEQVIEQIRVHRPATGLVIATNDNVTNTSFASGSRVMPGQYAVKDMQVLLSDYAVSAALAAMGDDASIASQPAYIPTQLTYRVMRDSAYARTRTAIASIHNALIRAESTARISSPESDDPQVVTPRPAVVVNPPTVWGAGPQEASAILQTLHSLSEDSRFIPIAADIPTMGFTGRSYWPAGYAAPAVQAPVVRWRYPLSDTARYSLGSPQDDLGNNAGNSMGELAGKLDQFEKLVRWAPQEFVSTDVRVNRWKYFLPFAFPALATMSPSGYRIPDSAWRAQLASTTVTALEAALGSVELVPPGSVFTMGSDKSPILFIVKNRLPFATKVVVDIATPPQISVQQLGVVDLPANGSRTFTLPTRTSADSALYEISLGLRIVDGAELGQISRVFIRNSGFGKVTFFLTIAAGVIFVVLVLRKRMRRSSSEQKADS